jgi:hypothetical protein
MWQYFSTLPARLLSFLFTSKSVAAFGGVVWPNLFMEVYGWVQLRSFTFRQVCCGKGALIAIWLVRGVLYYNWACAVRSSHKSSYPTSRTMRRTELRGLVQRHGTAFSADVTLLQCSLFAFNFSSHPYPGIFLHTKGKKRQ